MRQIPNKRADKIVNIVEQAWFTRYLWPTQIVFNRGTELMPEFATTYREEYGLTTQPITAKNPQTNAINERVHQTLGNILRTMELYEKDLDSNNPFGGILAAIMFAIRSTYNTTRNATPTQLVFRQHSILNIPIKANWDLIKQNKQKIINENNKKENKKRLNYQYQVDD